MFGRFKNAWLQAKASTLIQNALKEYKNLNPLFSADIEKSGFVFVKNVWDDRPDVFEGKFGQKPHKIVVATRALAKATQEITDESRNKLGVVWAFAYFLEEIEVNGRLYPFNSLDWQLIEESKEVFKNHFQKVLGEE